MIRRSTQGRLSRAGAVALVAGVVLGAVVGATLHRAPGSPFRASTVVLVSGDGASALGATREARTRTLARLLRETLPGRGEVGPPSSSRPPVEVSSDPGAGIVVLAATGTTPASAAAASRVLANRGIALAERMALAGMGLGAIAADDFDADPGAWGAASSFSAPPAGLRLYRHAGRYDATSLSVKCGENAGCGAAAQVGDAVRPGAGYTGSVWARTIRGDASLKAVLGSDPGDFATGRSVRLTPRWRRVVVAWAPRKDASSIELAVLRRGTGNAVFAIDAALVTSHGLLSSSEERRALDVPPTVIAGASRALPPVGSATGRWAVIGALGGLAVAGVGLAAAGAARNRQRQCQH